MNDLLKTALEYAAKGKKVFPLRSLPNGECSCGNRDCDSPGKHPRTPHGFKDATTDPQQIERWWGQWPDANIGMPTGRESGVVVLDVDPRNGGTESFYQLQEKYGKIPVTTSQTTGGQGSHFIFEYPIGKSVSSTADLNGYNGIDIKADGGYILLPPSKTKTDYSWVSTKVKPAPLPSWLLELIVEKPKAKAEPIPDKIPAGKRNDALASIAGSLRRPGFTTEAIFEALKVENKRCVDKEGNPAPLGENELRQIAQSIGSYPPASNGTPGGQPKVSIAEILTKAGFDELTKDSSGDDIEKVVRNLPQLLAGADKVRLAGIREEASKKLKLVGFSSTKSLLDAVLNTGSSGSENEDRQGSAVTFSEPDPWPDRVDGPELFAEVKSYIRQYLILPPGAASVLAAWIIATWAVTVFDIICYLLVLSATRECGKTRVLEVIEFLSRKAFSTISSSPATIYRIIEKEQPTFLMDEAESLSKMSDHSGALIEILNGGYERGKVVPRCEGDKNEVRYFNVFGFKALASTRRLWDTIEGRSIIIKMQRKSKSDTVKRFRRRTARKEARVIARRISRWAQDNMLAIESAEPDLPVFLGDREQDVWECLLAVAVVIGGDTYSKLVEAAKSLRLEDEDNSTRIQVVKDLNAIFGTKDKMFSEAICEELGAMEDRRWPEYRNGKRITQNQLARLLKDFQTPNGLSLKPMSIRIGTEGKKGYKLAWFTKVFDTYAPDPPSKPAQPAQPNNDKGFSGVSNRHKDLQCAGLKSGSNPHQQGVVPVVPDEKGGEAQETSSKGDI